MGDHLVQSGKQGNALEKHVEKDMLRDMKEEEEEVKKDLEAGMTLDDLKQDDEDGKQAGDPLKELLEGFWAIFDDYASEFGDKTLKLFQNGHPVFDQLKALQAKIHGTDPISEEEVTDELDKIDLKTVGAGLGSGRVLPVNDIVEELVLIPTVPFGKLKELEKVWRNGEQDSVSIFSELQQLHEKGLIPSGWLQKGVDRQEKEDQEQEPEPVEKT